MSTGRPNSATQSCVVEEPLRLVDEEDDVEVGPAVGRLAPSRIRADDQHAAHVLPLAGPVRDLRGNEVVPRVHVQEKLLRKLELVRVDAAQRELTAHDPALELGQQRLVVRARKRAGLRDGASLGEGAAAPPA